MKPTTPQTEPSPIALKQPTLVVSKLSNGKSRISVNISISRGCGRICRKCLFAVIVLSIIATHSALAFSGANAPWTTYEAENMTVSVGGTILGPQYGSNNIASESSGRECVQLNGTGQYVEFTAQSAANSMVVRYSVPDTASGTGTNYTISLYTNGVFVEKLPMTSMYSWRYGSYPFTNNPSVGSPRNFYDEVRTNGLNLNPGDVVRLKKDSTDTATNYVIDLVDLENVAAPISAPTNSYSIVTYGGDTNGVNDSTVALKNCINAAQLAGKIAWLPVGTYIITNTINLPSNVTVQGAGMWYSKLVGNPVLYTNAARRVTLYGSGSNIHLADFAIIGKLNYRNDPDANDGLDGSYGTGSTIAHIWVEHTKTGAWLINSSGLVVSDCRFRDTIADGINLCVGMRGTTVTNCTARGTGDDCFPIWPTTYTAQTYTPGLNVITHCTAQSPWLANGGAIYGGVSNRIEDCQFLDITYGCGILISTTFSVANSVVTNSFSGTTVVQRCDLIRCGGYDPGRGWRAALQLCLDSYNFGISGVNLNNLNIADSISDGLSIVGGTGRLTNAVAANVSIPNYGIGVSGRHALWARNDAIGSMIVSNSTIVEYQNDSSQFDFTFAANRTQPPIGLHDGSTSITYATSTNISQPFTSTAGASVLVVSLVNKGASASNSEPATLTWNGQTLTQAVTTNNTAGPWRDATIYYLYNPTPGTDIIAGMVANGATNTWLTAFTLSGVDTSTAPLTGSANGTTNASSVSFPVANVPSNAWAVVNGVWSTGAGNLVIAGTGGTTNTTMDNADSSTTTTMGYVAGLSAGTDTFTATAGGSSKMAFVAAIFQMPQPPIGLHDGSTSITYATSTNISQPFTSTAGASVLVVSLVNKGASASNSEPATLTWNGQTLTQAVTTNNTAGPWRDATIYYLYNPTPGTNIIRGTVANGATDIWLRAFTLSGVDTGTAPVPGCANGTNASSVSFSVANMPSNACAVVNGVWSSGGGNLVITGGTSGTPNTSTDTNDSNTTTTMGFISGLSAGTNTFTATAGGSSKMAFVGVIFQMPQPPIGLHDGSTSIAYAASNNISQSFTSTLGASVLVVSLLNKDASTSNSEPATLTWNSKTLTQAVTTNNTAAPWRDATIYYLYNPPPGTANITGTVANGATNTWLMAFTLSGVDTSIAPLTGGANGNNVSSVAFPVANVPSNAWAVVNGVLSGSVVSLGIAGTGGTPNTTTDNTDSLTTTTMGYISGLSAGADAFTATAGGSGKMAFVGVIFQMPQPPHQFKALIHNPSVTVLPTIGSAQMSIQKKGVVNIRFYGSPNQNYVVQTTTNLSTPWWTISTNTATTDGTLIFADPNATNDHQYYRMQP